MKAYTEYWAATMIRGLLAIIAGLSVLFVPEMVSTILLRPFAVVLSILCLAAYFVLDSAIVLTTSFMIPHGRPGRVALRLQGIYGALIGVFLFALVYNRVQLYWFLYLAAIQAVGVAVTEFIVGRGTSKHHGANWCYASAAIAAVSAMVLLSGGNLGPREIAWLMSGYLGVFGFNFFALSARMLFAAGNLPHVAHV